MYTVRCEYDCAIARLRVHGKTLKTLRGGDTHAIKRLLTQMKKENEEFSSVSQHVSYNVI